MLVLLRNELSVPIALVPDVVPTHGLIFIDGSAVVGQDMLELLRHQLHGQPKTQSHLFFLLVLAEVN